MLLELVAVTVLSAAPSLEHDFPHAKLSVRPGESTVSTVIGLDFPATASEESARRFLQRYAGAFGLLGEDTLVLRDVRGASYRFERRKRDVPVLDAQLVVTFDAQAHLTMVHAGAQVPPAKGAFVRAPPSEDAKAFWVRDGDVLRPAWRLKTADGEELTIDAETGLELSRRRVEWTANGRVFDFSPSRSNATTLCAQLSDGGYTACATSALRPLGPVTSSLSGPRVVARNCLGQSESTSCLPRATPNGSGDFDETPNLTTSTTDRFGEVMAYYQADRFSSWLDQVSPPFQAAGGLGTVDVFTNINGYEGAFFNEAGPFNRFGVRLGQGPVADWAYDGDVLWHELGHGVVERTSRFGFYSRDARGLQGDPGSLNEGTADCLSLAFKGSPQLGEYVGSRLFESGAGPSAPYLRTVEKKRMCQISSIEGSTLALGGRVGEIHADGVIWGSFFWALRQRLASLSTAGLCTNCNAAEVVLMRALDTLGSGASFNDATLAVQQIAASVFGAQAAQLVGCMSCEWQMPSCEGRVRDVYPGETHEALLVDSSAGSYGNQTPTTFQYGLDVPASTTVGFNRFAIESGSLTILARFGSPITWSGTTHNATHTITSQGQTLPPQPGAGRWYLQGVHDGAAIRRFGFRVAFVPAGSPGARPAPPAFTCALGGGLPSGCNCTPQCTGKQCGSDGCGGACGTCPSGQACSASSQCGCVPQCAGKQCGPDGCGSTCGACGAGQTCSTAGTCGCTPSCSGKQCGDDGCGGSCGACGAGQFCSAAFSCVTGSDPCEGKQCGSDGNGGSCGACPADFECSAAGQCTSMVSGCGNKLCGPDGNGGSCGTCESGESCTATGTCVKDEPMANGGCGCSQLDVLAASLALLVIGRRRRSA